GAQAERLHVLLDGDRLPQAEEAAAPGRLLAAADAALPDGLAGHAGQRVELAARHRLVRVGNPRHLARAGAVVGRRHVGARADEVLADELGGVAARDALQLTDRVGVAGDADAALGSAERHVDDRALVR